LRLGIEGPRLAHEPPDAGELSGASGNGSDQREGRFARPVPLSDQRPSAEEFVSVFEHEHGIPRAGPTIEHRRVAWGSAILVGSDLVAGRVANVDEQLLGVLEIFRKSPERNPLLFLRRSDSRRENSYHADGREAELGTSMHGVILITRARGPVVGCRPFNLRNSHEDIAMSQRKPALQAPKTVVADDPEDRKGRLKNIGGSKSDHWNNILANQAIQALWVKNSSPEERDKQWSATVAALMGIAPKDELEGMMAAQLIAAHNAAMECYRRAMIGEQNFEGRRENLAQANKLSRTYATLLEALNRHRGKGQQKVTVEHVHVHAGGQAVVGMVATSPGQPGGGDGRNNEEQPHAKQIAYAPQPTLRRANEDRQPVPVAGDAERPLPAARRPVAGRAQGQ
jgi:hypothetical protein